MHSRFAQVEKHLFYQSCFLLKTFASNKEFSAATQSSNCRTFHSEINLIFNCEVIEKKVLTGANILRDRWLQQTYCFMTDCLSKGVFS